MGERGLDDGKERWAFDVEAPGVDVGMDRDDMVDTTQECGHRCST